jgi:hypothetical protein
MPNVRSSGYGYDAGFGASREMFCSKGQTLAAMVRLPGYGTG